MTARKVMSIIGLGLTALLIVFLFLPFIEGDYNRTENFWGILKLLSGEEVSVIYLVELILAMILLILQICGVLDDTKIAIIPIGFAFTICLALFFLGLNNSRLEYFQFGLYLNLFVSLAALIILGIGGLLNNDKQKENAKPIGYDPQTGKPIYATPKKIVGYDPQTGVPIYK